MESGVAILSVLVFMGGLLFSGMMLDELIGNIFVSVREKTFYKFPVGHAIVAIVFWTALYAMHYVKF